MDSGAEVNQTNTSTEAQTQTLGNESYGNFSLQPWFTQCKPNKQEEPEQQDP